MSGPLSHVRILDLTHVLNGPFCTMLLAHMGAEVLKVEYGEGDRYRHSWMPPEAKRDGYEFLMVNSNKKGITINLKHDKGKHIVRELVKKSDVVVENFARGVMDRHGFSYEALQELNPRIIYASSRGFGDSGPYAHVRANAATILGMSGWQHAAQNLAGKPGAKVLGIGDEAAGVSLALGICAALYHREVTGKGQKIEVSMQEALLGFMNGTFHTHFEGRAVAFAPKPCADGHYAFHLHDMPDKLWMSLCTCMQRPELVEDPRFVTSIARRQNHHEVETLLTEWIRGKTRKEVWEMFSSVGISSAPVMSLGEVIEDPHIKARKAFVQVDHPQAGSVTLLAPWIHFSETPTEISRAAPLIGQDNCAVYGELLGLSEAEVRQLAQEGAI